MVHTGDEGVVTALLADDMVKVRLVGDQDEIPVFVDDVVRSEDFTQAVKPAKIKPLKPGSPKQMMPSPPPPPVQAPRTQYTILKSYGIQLAFDPIVRTDGTTEKFAIYLLNDTRLDVIYNFELYLDTHLSVQSSAKLKALSFEQIGHLRFDDLNENPSVIMECWRITTEGEGTRFHKELKLKAKTFFSKVLTAPLLDRPVHLFRMFEQMQDKEESFDAPKEQEDLKSYTQRNARPKPNVHPNSVHGKNEVKDLAEFQTELDLHIENLVEDFKKLNKAEILHLQIRHFETYLDKAVRMGVERVFIIHGLGTGKLKDTIATRLFQHPYVKTFKNEFHPRYGYGATEVEFL
jgi:hypothetical protein